MPPVSTRAALAATAPVPASAIGSLASSFGTLQISGTRRASTVASSSSIPSSSFTLSTSTTSSSSPSHVCCRRQPASLLALSASRRPLLSSVRSTSLTFTSPGSSAAAFSTTPVNAVKAKRRQMRLWLKERARPALWPKGGEEAETDNRLGSIFRNNKAFQREPVLSPEMRQLIWYRVMVDGDSIKTVSADYTVDMRRVAAVVRLMDIENKWRREGRQLAEPYNAAIMRFLPKWGSNKLQEGIQFEDINEVFVHPYSKQQLFVPVPESREFTREDAAKAFHPKLLTPDKRMPLGELIQIERDVDAGTKTYEEGMQQFREKAAAEQQAIYDKARAAALAEEASTVRVKTPRFEFRIKDYNVDSVGPEGRGRNVAGQRYGVPFNDRRRGVVKIPTSVG